MYTVKWIGENGCQFLYGDARGVSFTPGNGQDDKAKVSFYFKGEQSATPGDCHCILEHGRVYVMNEAGRTVANYILETKEFPHGLMPREAA
jgi:hypothetical protein